MIRLTVTSLTTYWLDIDHYIVVNCDDDVDMLLQSLSHEPAIVNLLQQQYDIDVNIRSLKSFMVFTLASFNFVHCCCF